MNDRIETRLRRQRRHAIDPALRARVLAAAGSVEPARVGPLERLWSSSALRWAVLTAVALLWVGDRWSTTLSPNISISHGTMTCEARELGQSMELDDSERRWLERRLGLHALGTGRGRRDAPLSM
ncbi:MAG: hypothetical protein GY716_00520 [bacterium]|nr:hypothetical protein [bacterium]